MFESIIVILIDDGRCLSDQLQKLLARLAEQVHVQAVIVGTSSSRFSEIHGHSNSVAKLHWIETDTPSWNWRTDDRVTELQKSLPECRVVELSLSVILRFDERGEVATLRHPEISPRVASPWSRNAITVNAVAATSRLWLARVSTSVSSAVAWVPARTIQSIRFAVRGVIVATSLLLIGAATLGLLLPTPKSLAVASNEFASNEAANDASPENVEEIAPIPGRRLLDLTLDDLKKPDSTGGTSPIAPVEPPRPPVPAPTQTTLPSSRQWKPIELDQSNSKIEQRLRDCATYLASDELEGRGVRTRGIDLAADYLADEFQKTGLQANLVNGQPFQEFDLYSLGRERVVQELQLRHIDAKHDFALDRDFTSLMAANSNVPFNLEVVFAGYGISSPADRYDDYDQLDVEGKAVVILRGLPPHLAKSPTAAQAVFLRAKVANAAAHRAAAVILCTSDSETKVRLAQPDQSVLETLLRVEITNETIDTAIPIVHCQRSVLAEVCEKSGFDLAAVEEQIHKTSAPKSQLLEKFVLHGRSGQTRVGRKLKNVLAALPGTGDKAEQTIVVGAHYDHLGRGGYGSLSFSGERDIHNGADDNASGTAILLEVARQLSARKEPLSRRVLFAAFSGEELGLVGSKRYVREPVVPLNQTVAMLNLDMVGRLRDEKLTIYGTETSPMWPTLLESAPSLKAFNVSRRAGGFGPSDHASFYEKGVPVLHFFTGFHPQYHRPGDDSELLNIEGMRLITSLVVDLVQQLSDPTLQPAHRATTPVPQLSDISPGMLDEVISGKGGHRRPTMLGVVLGPSQKGDGLVVERTLPGSLAQRFGIRVGDVIQELDGAIVKTSDEMITKVRSKKPDETLTVMLVRSGVKLELKVRF